MTLQLLVSPPKPYNEFEDLNSPALCLRGKGSQARSLLAVRCPCCALVRQMFRSTTGQNQISSSQLEILIEVVRDSGHQRSPRSNKRNRGLESRRPSARSRAQCAVGFCESEPRRAEELPTVSKDAQHGIIHRLAWTPSPGVGQCEQMWRSLIHSHFGCVSDKKIKQACQDNCCENPMEMKQ